VQTDVNLAVGTAGQPSIRNGVHRH
jgi:hypothetical protein